MNIYPYVYRIDHPSGEFYIGFRCANTVPAIEDFGHKYKTSATQLSYPFEEYTQTIIAEFFTDTAKTDAYNFEQALIYENWGKPGLANKRCYYGKSQWSQAGRSLSAEARQKMSEAKRGTKHSTEAKQKMSEAKLGKVRKPFSSEHRQRMSEAIRAMHLSRRQNP